MRHNNSGRKLGRNPSHRKALFRNMAKALLIHGRIHTTEAKAKELMAAGDAKAAEFYSVFNKNPELAAFLRKLDSLKRILGTKTTLILDTEATPFDIFKIKVGSLEQENAPKK